MTTSELPNVTFQYGDHEVDLESLQESKDKIGLGNKINRMVFRSLKKTAAKVQKQYASLVHPETGERPKIVLYIPDSLFDLNKIQVRLITDSPELKEWIKSKGIVIEDVSKEP